MAFNGAPHSDTFVITHLGPSDIIGDLLREALAEITSSVDPGIPVLVGNCGHWGHQGFRPRRPIESVMLESGVLDDLVADMERFYASGTWYRERGVPWQRGYLFAGIPGAGKTSAAIALAGKLDLSIAIVSLSAAEMDDQALARMMLGLPERSLLLIEDIDALFNSRESKCKVTFAGFLNALDGVVAPEGRMLVMTTNHPDKLDPALIRFGRVDRRVDFTFATPDQARRLFLWFFRDAELTTAELARMAARFAATITAEDVSMAAIQEHLVSHRDAPMTAAFRPIAGTAGTAGRRVA
jgi:chaperone BCS1